MDFYLIDPAGPQIHFPVNPEEVQIRREKQYETVNIMSLGEVDFAQREKVKEITFSSFFPARPRNANEQRQSYFRYMIPGDWNPQLMMNRLNDFMIRRKPLRFLITDTEVNVLVMVSSHNSTFRGGEPGDVYFDLTLRTWREAKVRTAAEGAGQVGDSAIPADSRPDVKPPPPIYVVKPGDSLWKIAKLELGDGGRYRDIYELNRDIVGPDPDLIFSGQKLVMPS